MLDHNNERSLAAMRIVTAHIAIAGAKPDLITTRVRIIEYCDYYVSGLRRIPLVAARASTSSQAEPWNIVDATGRIGYEAASGPKVHGIKFMIDSGSIVINRDQK
jgi:hypothetical protein